MGDWNTLPIRLSAIELKGSHMTCFIGVDLHKTQFTVYVRIGDEVEDLAEIKQYPTTVAGYTEFLNRILAYKTASFDVKIGVESTKKTDRHDVSTISEFLAKDVLPESYICSKETENLRRLLKPRERLVRSVVGQKNEVLALLVSMRLNDELRSL